MTHNADWLSKNIILLMGKGGVGKTTVAQAAARLLASQGKRTLLCEVLSVSGGKHKLEQIAPNLMHIALRSDECFREYIILKLKLKALYTAFLGSKITQYLERAAPGVREMVLLGKIWFERKNFDHIIVDMPSTGYALSMIHTPFNFANLFPGGPIYNDSQEMVKTFSNPNETAFVIVSLAEEMPIQESLEMAENLKQLVPQNPAWLVLNRLIHVSTESKELYQKKGSRLSDKEKLSPLWLALAYLINREVQQSTFIADLQTSWAPYLKPWMEINEASEKNDIERAQVIANSMEGANG